MSMVYTFTIPTLETEHLLLRGWREEDLDSLVEALSDADYTRFIGGPFSRNAAWRKIAGAIGQWHLRGYGMFALEEKASGAFVGYCGPHCPEGWPEPEIGWTLHPGFQGKGYATEAACESLRYAYTDLGWPTAISLVDDGNTPSRKVAERLGATYERTEQVTDFTAGIFRHLPPSEFLAPS